MSTHPIVLPTALTTASLFRDSVARNPGGEALHWREGKEWKSITWQEFSDRVDAVAAALSARGFVAGDRIAIVSENQPNWIIADLANATLGITTVGIYPTLPAPQIAYIVNDCGARAIYVQDHKQLAKVLEARTETPSLEQIFLLEGDDPDANALSIAVLFAEGTGKPAPRPEVDPESVACLIYTSGTTGDPKGAMLTHHNLADNCIRSLEHFRNGNVGIQPEDRFLSFLPLAHSFERIIHLFALSAGASIVYSQGARTLLDEMSTMQPTIMGCVPRVFEAMQERILDNISKAPEKKRKLAEKALAAGYAVVDARQAGKAPGLLTRVEHAILDKLVLEKIRARFGGNWRFFISGGAALNPATARFFHALGFVLLEGYGLTETSPVISVNPAPRPKIGTVGTVIPGGEVKIAPDGEVCYRGANVMKGYFGNEQATRDMIDSDGWLHTGDIGTLDAEGYLRITDRKKDIIVLANGKNVSPLPIESTLKASPMLQEVVLIGDKQNVITALVAPNMERLGEWAKEQGLSFADNDALIALPESKKRIRQEIDAHSKALADFEKIKRFTLINAVFSIDGGELTPTLKVKRKVIAQKFASQIAAMRGEDA